MPIADVPTAEQRIVMRGHHRITEECTLQITLYDDGGRLYVGCLWIPDRPHWGDIDGHLAPKITASISQYLRKAAQIGNFLYVVGDA